MARPVYALATLRADIVASVPELTNLTFSMLGTHEQTFSASFSSTSVGAPKLAPLPSCAETALTTLGWE